MSSSFFDRKIYLHIGLGKCGTSSLQSFLASRGHELIARGFSYPALESLDAARKGEVTSGNAAMLARSLLDPSHFFYLPDKEQRLAELEAAFKVAESPNTILSSEFFSMLSRPQITELLAQINDWGAAVTVICYVRRQDELALSSYIQGLIAGHSSAKSSFADEVVAVSKRFAFSKLLAPWLELDEPNGLIVRVFHPTVLEKGDVVIDFLSLIGIEIPSTGPRPVRLNESLTAGGAYLLYLMRKELVPEDIVQRLIPILKRPTRPADKPCDVLLGRQYREQILELARPDNEKLALIAFPDSQEPLFPPEKPGDMLEHNVIPSADDVSPALMSFLTLGLPLQRQADTEPARHGESAGAPSGVPGDGASEGRG